MFLRCTRNQQTWAGNLQSRELRPVDPNIGVPKCSAGIKNQILRSNLFLGKGMLRHELNVGKHVSFGGLLIVLCYRIKAATDLHTSKKALRVFYSYLIMDEANTILIVVFNTHPLFLLHAPEACENLRSIPHCIIRLFGLYHPYVGL